VSYSIDTRTLQPGDIFIPVKGENFDGHDFIEEAQRKGADRILDVDLGEYAKEVRQKYNIPVIGITGSSGKTTVKDMLAAVLAKKFKVLKNKENLNNEIGLPLTLLQLEDDEYDLAIVELAMRGLGQIEYLAEIAQPTHALITNIGYTHLELLHTRESIALAKSEIMGKGMKVFLNERDDYYDFLRTKAEEKDALVVNFTYGNILESNENAVATVAKEFGLTDKEIEEGISSFSGSEHRQQIIDSKRYPGVKIIDDSYNSNPDAVRFAVALLNKLAGNKRKIAVLGDMKELGPHAEELHQKLDVSGLDLVIAYGELAQNIKHDFHSNDKEELINILKENIKERDYILFKGSRTMKMEELVTAVS